MSKIKSVKYVCENCGYARELSNRELIFTVIKNAIFSLFFVLGIVMFLILLFTGPFLFFDMVASSRINLYTTLQSDEIREIAINLTENCHGQDIRPICYATEIFKHTKDNKYVLPSLYKQIYSPEYTYNEGVGDCKNTAIMYVSLLRSVGVPSKVSCSTKHEHCVSVVFNYDGNLDNADYLVVDLTMPAMFIMKEGTSVWTYHRYQRIGIE